MINKYKLIYPIFLYTLILFLSCSINTSIFNDKKSHQISFNYNYYLLENDNAQFDIFYKIPYSDLVFIKDNDLFSSNLTSTIRINDTNNRLVYSESFSNKILLNSFNDTQSSNENIFSISVELPKDQNYSIYFEINDYNNHKKWDINHSINYESYNYLSQIFLFSKIDGKFKNIEHLNSDQLEKIDSLWLKYQVIDSEGINLDSLIIKLKNNKKSINIFNNKIIENHSMNFLPIDISNYDGKIKFEVKYKEIIKEITFDRENKKNIEYEILISPIQYILTFSQQNDYNDLDDINKIEFIKEFWENLNDAKLLFEFYNRVEYTNNKYSDFKNIGSMSDRGRIYIIDGPPNSIERRLSDEGEYEIWNYSLKQYIFLNKFGYFECIKC